MTFLLGLAIASLFGFAKVPTDHYILDERVQIVEEMREPVKEMNVRSNELGGGFYLDSYGQVQYKNGGK